VSYLEPTLPGFPAPPPPPDGDRDGATYVAPFDRDRLNRQARAVFDAMADGLWHTLSELSYATGAPEASVSARLRDLRKPRFGALEVERRRDGDAAGTWLYRLNLEGVDR
jgi:hypothetical protein